MTPEARFRDRGTTIYDLTDEILVVCPRCEGSARIVAAEEAGRSRPRRLVCSKCGFTQDSTESGLQGVWYGQPRPLPIDPYFSCPLWLQVPCVGETLWVYNRRHLDFLEALVGAKHRERTRNEKYGWHNGSLASRLPRWIRSAKNRPKVLHAIATLRKRL